MIAIGDLNRLNRYLYRGGVTIPQYPVGFQTTREDVIEVVVELKEMLDRMLNRFNLIH